MDRTAPATQSFGLTTWMVIRKRAVSCLEAWAEFGGRRVYKGHLPAEDVRYRKADIGRRRKACVCRKLESAILMVKAAEDR